MTKYTPLQTLAKVHSQLWWNIRLVGSIEIMLGPESASWNDLIDVEKVMRATVAQLDVIIRRERDKTSDHRNLRLAEDFAFRSKMAKAYQEASKVFEKGPSGPSHK